MTTSSAGLEACGKTVCIEPGRLKVLEFENVGDGLTGPIDRREAAKSGSRPSMSIAGKSLVSVIFRFLHVLHGRDLKNRWRVYVPSDFTLDACSFEWYVGP